MTVTSASLAPLTAPPDRLAPFVVIAAVGHVGVAVVLMVVTTVWASDPAPLIRPEDAMEVSIVSLPKSPSALPERAQRQAAPQAPVPPTPEPAPEAPARQSDLAVPSPEPQPVPKAVPPDSKRKLAELNKQLEMDRLLAELDADDGPVDRDASSPDGTVGAPATSLDGAAASDPVYAAYIAKVSKLFLEGFRPLPALKGTGLKTTVLVSVDVQGRVTARDIERSSGNPAWDRAALAAAELVTTLPLPPEKYRDGRADEYRIHFEDTP